MKTLVIGIKGGEVIDVDGLPDNYNYVIKDYDEEDMNEKVDEANE